MKSEYRHLLFAYGLLRYGSDHGIAKTLRSGSEYLGKGYIFGRLYLVDTYPGAILINGKEKVWGDVFAFDDDKLWHLMDEFEEIGFSDEYSRNEVQAFINDRILLCQTYLYQRPVSKLFQITSGDFLFR